MSKQKLINIVKSIILKYSNPTRIYLYGSQANGESKEGSDIDIAYDDVEFTKNYLIEDEIDKLETLVKIDVSNLAKCEDRFINRVKSTGKVLYSSSKELRAEDGLYNFSSALKRYKEVIVRESDLKEQGMGDMFLDLLIKRFEFTFEMSWKALKRYLDFVGIDAKSPRAVFKEAYAQQLLKSEAVWLDMIEQRNLSSHVYDEFEVSGILEVKESFLDAFLLLETELKNQINRLK